MNKLLPLVLAVAAGCASKPAPTDDFTDLAALDAKSDAFSSRMKVLAPIHYGDAPVSVKYTRTPRYRALPFDGRGGDGVNLFVRSTQGDAVTWLLDAHYNVVASNDDESASSTDSHIVARLPSDGRYYIVFRDYDLASHYFTVTLTAKTSAPCAVAFDVNDEPPVPVSDVEWLTTHYMGSFELHDGFEPECLDFTDAQVQRDVAADVLANNRIQWNDATPPTLGAISTGAKAFDAALQSMPPELASFDASGLVKPAGWAAMYAKLGADLQSIVGDSATNPSAYVEFKLHIEAEECSQDGLVRLDVRTGQILILRIRGC